MLGPGGPIPRSRGRNDRFGYWIAFGGLLVMAASRRANSNSLLLLGLLLAAAGVAVGLWSGRTEVGRYASELLRTRAGAQAGPVTTAGAAPDGAFVRPLRYSGVGAWPGTIRRGLALEVSDWGLRLRAGWIGRLFGRENASMQLPWSSITSVEMPAVAKMRSALRPVMVSTTDAPGVVLFFTSRPEALRQVIQARLEASPRVTPAGAQRTQH